jgi:probable rRNA maturation factor
VRIRQGKIVPRDDGKRIEELVGAATTRTRSVSVAKMLAPPGWSEPPQRPAFDEVVLVLKGALTLVLDGRKETIRAGETGLVPKRTRVTYRNDGDGPCEYFSVCAPAFLPALAHMEPRAKRPNLALVKSEVSRGTRHARRLRERTVRCLDQLGLEGREVYVRLVGDRAIRDLNRTFRKKDRATDVLSFPAGDLPAGTPGPLPLGDVVISLDTAASQARALGEPLDHELHRYLVHGILHLAGHDHVRPADRRRMSRLEAQLLGITGMIDSRAGRRAR